MTLTMTEMLGALNEKALRAAQKMMQEKRSNQDIVAELRRLIAMPHFPGNLLAVRITDQKKIQKAELPEEYERARLLLLLAVQKDIEDLEPRYKTSLMNSHK